MSGYVIPVEAGIQGIGKRSVVLQSGWVYFLYMAKRIMPLISSFYGIMIRMFFYDTEKHNLPHLHAVYQATVDKYKRLFLGEDAAAPPPVSSRLRRYLLPLLCKGLPQMRFSASLQNARSPPCNEPSKVRASRNKREQGLKKPELLNKHLLCVRDQRSGRRPDSTLF